MPYAVELVRILAWPTTTLAVVLLLRSEIRSFARTLSGRMESAKSIVLGHRGLEIKGANESASAEVQRRRSRFARFVRSIPRNRIWIESVIFCRLTVLAIC